MVLLSSLAHALGPFFHRWNGIIVEVDEPGHAIDVRSTDGRSALHVLVKEGRTRLAGPNGPCVWSDLHPRDKIKLYYTKEFGAWIATQITLDVTKTAEPKPTKADISK